MLTFIKPYIKKTFSKELYIIIDKILCEKRLSLEEGLFLFKHAELPLLGMLAHIVNERKNGSIVSYIKNIHIEFTNKCINHCAFCSFRSKTENDAWELTFEDILRKIEKHINEGIKEVHIVGGIHPDKDIFFWLPILNNISKKYPELHIKAFTAAELDYMICKANLSISKGLKLLIENGLNSIPGGGAEIFDSDIRNKLFPSKIDAARWLDIHYQAHLLNIPSNATMLYGHIENISHRLKHLDLLRELQDKTHGFNAFIPLKFKNKHNTMSYLKEMSTLDDLKMFAFSRIYLDNFPHIKAYWPMLGKDTAFLSLDFGVDDLDGTISNTTAIYTRAGASEINPEMSVDEITQQVSVRRKIPCERDALYNYIL